MLTFYTIRNDALAALPVEEALAAPQKLVWMDLYNPTPEEEAFLEKMIEAEIPTREEMHDIEMSARLYQENGALYATASIVTMASGPQPEIHAVTFVLKAHNLITVRYSDPKPFHSVLNRKDIPATQDGSSILISLTEVIVERIADILEGVSHALENTTRKVLAPDNIEGSGKTDYKQLLRDIALSGDLLSKARESMVSLARLLSYVSQSTFCKPNSEEHSRLQVMLRDLAPLSDHASFLSNKVNFLLDAVLGMLNIEQNSIIKIFSVASVVFLPPTLVASIYGMNFDFMPELKMHFGYPIAICIMILSSYLPYRFFKKKGWL